MPRAKPSEGRRDNRGSGLVEPRKARAEVSEEAAAAALTLQFLGSVGDGRTYGETMEAWRSTCPRMSIWEDALSGGLVPCPSALVLLLSALQAVAQQQPAPAKTIPDSINYMWKMVESDLPRPCQKRNGTSSQRKARSLVYALEQVKHVACANEA